MRRKRLNHYADVVCKMFVGWRMADDLEKLSDLPNGTISLNLLTGVANHSVSGPIDLHVAKEIRAWLQQQSVKEGIDISQLITATLEIDVDTSKVGTNKNKVVMFNFGCRSNIQTSETTYHATLKEAHKWHTRVAT